MARLSMRMALAISHQKESAESNHGEENIRERIYNHEAEQAQEAEEEGECVYRWLRGVTSQCIR